MKYSAAQQDRPVVRIYRRAHLEVGVENHDLLGRDEEVDLGGRLVLTLGRLWEKAHVRSWEGYDALGEGSVLPYSLSLW